LQSQLLEKKLKISWLDEKAHEIGTFSVPCGEEVHNGANLLHQDH